jgi:hypothetical protein
LHWTNYGKDKLCLVGWFLSPYWPSRKLQVCDFFRRLVEAATPGRGGWVRDCGPCPDFVSYTLAFALQREENQGQPQCSRRRSADSNVIHLADLAIAGDGLDCPAGLCRPYLSRQVTWSTLGQRKYLPSFRTMGFHTSAKCERKLAVRALLWTAKSGTP